MKNIQTILSEIGITISEDKKNDFETAFNENYKTVAEVERIRTARDDYKSQLETAQSSLKEFEGVDVKDLQGKIKDLNEQMSKQAEAHQQKIADMEFNNVLDGAITKSGAKNATAIKALLDLETLKASKNQAEDIEKALNTVKSENDYMFASEEPFNNPVRPTNPPPAGDNDDLMRKVMGLEPKK